MVFGLISGLARFGAGAVTAGAAIFFMNRVKNNVFGDSQKFNDGLPKRGKLTLDSDNLNLKEEELDLNNLLHSITEKHNNGFWIRY